MALLSYFWGSGGLVIKALIGRSWVQAYLLECVSLN